MKNPLALGAALLLAVGLAGHSAEQKKSLRQVGQGRGRVECDRDRSRERLAVRPLAGIGLGASIAFAVPLLVAVPGVGHSQNLICASHSLNRDDASRLKVAARALVPASAHVVIESACINPGRALGFIETQKIVTAAGVQQWWTMSCRRNAKEWECEAPQLHQFIATSVDVDGKPRAVELSFDKNSSLDQAKMLAARAIKIYGDPASRLPQCGSKEPKESDELGKSDERVPLPTDDTAIGISVSTEKRFSAVLDDFAIQIDFRPTADNASFEAECWGLYIIVT